MSGATDVRRLHRPRSVLVRATAVALALLAVYSWTSGDIAVDDLFEARRMENLRSFLTVDIVPFRLRGHSFELSAWLAWMGELFSSRGRAGSIQTLAISALAICLAAIGALLLAPFAARTVASADPFASASGPQGRTKDRFRRRAWNALSAVTRAFLVFLRAIPEYIWAFLLLAMLGPTAWPAVLALAIHNAGILGKLGGETVENLEVAPLRALRGLGASRTQVTVLAALPLALPRFLLYFFYRFETCVREATVLGLLGVVSLGYWIQDARARHFYDEMLFFVALGAVIVLVGDVLSTVARAFLRREA